jgi:DNA-binding phage protein
MLLERLLTTPKENRLALVQQEEALFDMHFFSILSRILQSTMSQGDQNSQKELLDLQNLLFENTKVGKEIYTQAKESESVIKALQEAGKEGLTREKLLDVILAHTSDIQLSTLVSMARSGMDYEFFKILSGKIDASSDEKEKKALTELREKLLQLTEQIDQRVKDELEKTRALLEKIVNSANIESALEENIESINEFFLQVLESEIAQARKNGNLDRITKLEQIMIFIEKSAQPTKEVQFLESLLDISDEAQLEKTLKENLDKINQEFLGLLNTLVAQSEGQSANAEIAEKLRKIYKTALRISMTANLGKA